MVQLINQVYVTLFIVGTFFKFSSAYHNDSITDVNYNFNITTATVQNDTNFDILKNAKLLPILFAPISENIKNEKCKNHSHLYLRELEKFTLWATQMFDANTKFPSGILIGSTFDFGNFDECVQIHADVESEHIQGQYCSITISIDVPNRHKEQLSERISSSTSNSSIHTWDKVQLIHEDRKSRMRNEFHLALCVPASCTFEDVQQHVSNIFEDIKSLYQIEGSVSVKEHMCQVDNGFDFSKNDIIFICVVAIFILIVYFCTLYDLFTSISAFQHFRLMETSKTHRSLEAFSASANIKKLLKYNKNDDNFECIHGLKFVSLCLIIMGHRLMFVLGGAPIINTDYVEEGYSKLQSVILLNGPVIVDTFFNISGFLVCYLLLHEYAKRKHVNIFILYLHRYVRLTPVYIVVMAFYCTLFVKIGSGALWLDKVGREQQKCIQSWWANILYINNYVEVDNLCMIQSWYITCDMHLFMIAPFIVYLLVNQPKLGKVVLAILTVVSIIITFIITYTMKLDAILLLYMKTLKDPIADPTFRNMYIPTHTRATPYFIGMIAGYIRYKIKTTNYKINRVVVWCGWILAVCLIEGTVFSAWVFYLPNQSYNEIVAAFYGSFHRITWSLGISWMIVAMSTENGAFVEPLFAWKPLITLSRLTYCAFLCHGAVQMYSVASSRTPYYSSMFHLVWTSFADITTSFIVALVLTLLFESPILALENIFFRSKKSEISDDKDGKNMEQIHNIEPDTMIIGGGFVHAEVLNEEEEHSTV